MLREAVRVPRLGAVEAAVGTGSLDSLIDPVAEAGPTVADAVAEAVPAAGTVFVGAARSGVLVAPIHARGQAVHGVDRDPVSILPGVRNGLDLRSGDPAEQLASSEPGSLIGVVLAGFVEDLGPTAVSSLLGDVRRALADGGVAVVVTGDPADRNAVERDLRAGRGLAPATWAHLLERAGFDVEITPVDNDPRIGSIVVGRLG